MSSSRARILVAGLLVLGVVLAAGRALREDPPEAVHVATFESTLRGEPVRRGAFEQGERVETPAGGRVSVRAPGGVRLSVEESSEARFVTFAPLLVELAHGRIVAQTADEPLTLRYQNHLVRVGPRAAAELSSAPPRLVVTAGVVTLDGRAVSGQQTLAAR